MKDLNRALPSVDPSHFSMVPRSDVPRSTFATEHTHKSTFDMGYLVPIHVDEVLPGDVHDADVTIFARVNNLLFPLMDDLEIETFFFFQAARNLWTNFEKMMGAQDNPADSISFTIPQQVSAAGGFPISTIFDYLGLPTVGQVGGAATVSVNALPLRMCNDIYNEWFRDEDLNNSLIVNLGDGPDTLANYSLQRRNKKHDYFTSARPWPLKGGVEVSLPLGGSATVKTNATALVTTPSPSMALRRNDTGAIDAVNRVLDQNNGGAMTVDTVLGVNPSAYGLFPSNLYADLATATGSTINAMRLAIASQQYLEKNARGGTRFTEILRNHFGIDPEDSRLDRPEYIGGGRSQIHTQAIPQTSATGLTGGTTPVGSLTAQAVAADRHKFSYHAKEHGYIIGFACVRAALTYQQGLHRMWTRTTRFDHYWPTFANLGEQPVRNDEIYCVGTTAATDGLTFGYQEAWAAYRHRPSRISGLFRSTSAGTIDPWHAAQKFTGLPTLAATFMADTPPATRFLAAGAAANGMQILFDSVFNIRCTRAMPTYSIPGLERF